MSDPIGEANKHEGHYRFDEFGLKTLTLYEWDSERFFVACSVNGSYFSGFENDGTPRAHFTSNKWKIWEKTKPQRDKTCDLHKGAAVLYKAGTCPFCVSEARVKELEDKLSMVSRIANVLPKDKAILWAIEGTGK